MAQAQAATPPAEIVGWEADALSRRIRARDVPCIEVMDAYRAQIRRLNALVQLQDEAGLRAQG